MTIGSKSNSPDLTSLPLYISSFLSHPPSSSSACTRLASWLLPSTPPPPPPPPPPPDRLRRPSPPPPPSCANQFAPDAPAALTAHRRSSTARLWRRPRHLRSAAVSPASTTSRRAAWSSLYSRARR
ncbi:hypothetical protein HU200_062747 [Digitaria exilis]|uniref:Uncharacterized protein n=1 Tax=Digitaria exilis TaxID=1010633 RepID=A0A835A8B2_9POAL|nr:hypothetical protein HU200_062747 [Digitaria exilis]